MLGIGYFWAIKRSYNLTYLVQDYTARGFAHHVDFGGKPREGTDFDAILYGVQDRGAPNSGNPPQKYSGASLYVTGKSDLGDGWMARGTVNYITSFRFRQEWTQSFNEAIGSEIHSVGFLGKNWSTYTFNAIFARLENFQSIEVSITDPATGNSITWPTQSRSASCRSWSWAAATISSGRTYRSGFLSVRRRAPVPQRAGL